MSEPTVTEAVAPNSAEEWDLEQQAFNAANHPDVPKWAQDVIKRLWEQFVLREAAEQAERKAVLAWLDEASALSAYDVARHELRLVRNAIATGKHMETRDV